MKKIIDLQTKNEWRWFCYIRNLPFVLTIPIFVLMCYFVGILKMNIFYHLGFATFYFLFCSFIVFFISIEDKIKLLICSNNEYELINNFPPVTFNYKKDLESYLIILKKENDKLFSLLKNKELFYKYELLLEDKFKYLSLYNSNLEKISFLESYLKN